MEYLTVTEVARVIGVSASAVRRLVDAGELPSIRITDDGWRKVERQDVIDYAVAKCLRLDWAALQK